MAQVRCLNEWHGDDASAYHGDCVDVVRQLPDNSIGFSIYSPPFGNIFCYSDSAADMGNSATDEEFRAHYGFLVQDLARVTKSGRLSAVHCSDLPYTKWKDGVIGIKDFSGDIIRIHEDADWVLHSRVTIWRDPVVEMTRTKALGLLYKQLQKDSSRSRQGMADYLLVFRAPGENTEPIWHDHFESDYSEISNMEIPPHISVQFDHLDEYQWTDEAREIWKRIDAIYKRIDAERDRYYRARTDAISLNKWQQWASPVWMDIRQTNTLNVKLAREHNDERHLCPLQLDLIERALVMWSNPGDIVLSPFMGIGSEGYQALKLKRKFVGVELKESYWRIGCGNLAEAASSSHSLFDIGDAA